MAMTKEDVLRQIEGLEALLEEKVTVAYFQGDETDLSELSDDEDGITVDAFLDYLEEMDALESLFGGTTTAEIVDGELVIRAPQGSKG